MGRMAKSIRMMVGLQILKHMYNLSDEQVVAGLQENIYYRYFCGLDGDLKTWASNKILDASTLTKFRQRIGVEGLRKIENVIKAQLLKEKRINTKTQLVDTTAMEKDVAYPTDSNLLDRGRQRIVAKANKLKKLGLSVNVRSFARLARKQVLKIAKLGRGRKERIAEGSEQLIKYAKNVLKTVPTVLQAIKKSASTVVQREIERVKKQIEKDAQLLAKVINQATLRLQGSHSKEKVLSFHEPDICIIAKGKRSKRYEFGCKVSVSMDANGYVMGHQEYQYNAADVNTLAPALADWNKTFGDYPDEVGADRGYTSSNISEELSRVRRVAIPTRGRKRHPDSKKPYFRRLQRARNRIEPLIGHLKADHRMDRCRYSGKSGDTMNVGWASLAWNAKKWAREVQQDRRKAA
jgi:IS5 family transposase